MIKHLKLVMRPFPGGHQHGLVVFGRNAFELPELVAFVEKESPRGLLFQSAMQALGGGVGQDAGNVNAAALAKAFRQLAKVQLGIQRDRNIVLRRSWLVRHGNSLTGYRAAPDHNLSSWDRFPGYFD